MTEVDFYWHCNIKKVKGVLPEPVVQAWQDCVKARQALEQSFLNYEQVYEQDGQADQADQAWKVYEQAWEVIGQAGQAYDQAIAEHRAEIEALHQAECPNCPWDWDSKTIFSEGET